MRYHFLPRIKPSSENLNIEMSFEILNLVNEEYASIKSFKLSTDYEFILEIDLSEILFADLLGTISLSTIVSRILIEKVRIHIFIPNDENAANFLMYYGLHDLLSKHRKREFITIADSPGEIKQYLFGKRIFHSLPISSIEESESFLSSQKIISWLNNLETEIRQSDIFYDGKFSRIFGSELTKNIIEHAHLADVKGLWSNCFGAVGMRVIKVSDISDKRWIYSVFDPKFKNFLNKHITSGFVEIVVCDPGQGINSSLQKKYIDKAFERGLIENVNSLTKEKVIENTLAFAFDALGSAKENEDNLFTESHALSRILSLVNAYKGILCLFSDSKKNIYRLDQIPLASLDNGLGYLGEISNIEFQWGCYLQILIPLMESQNSSERQSFLLKNIGKKVAFDKTLPIIIPICNFFSAEDKRDLRLFRNKCIGLSKIIEHESNKRHILLDFSYIDKWSTDNFAAFLNLTLNSIINKIIIMVGLDNNLFADIRNRTFQEKIKKEEYNHNVSEDNEDIESEDRTKFIQYLSCLVDIFKVIPIINNRGEVYWLGSSNAILSDLLNQITEKPLSLDDIKKILSDSDKDNININNLERVLNTSNQYFKPNIKDVRKWKTFASQNVLAAYQFYSITELFEKELIDTKAILGQNKSYAYFMPHRKRFTNTFISSSRLFSRNEFLWIINETLGHLIRYGLDEKEPDMLICSTAPTVLFSFYLRQIFYTKPQILDIGHYFDEKNELLTSLGEYKRVVIIQDFLSSGTAISKIIELLRTVNVEPKLIVAVVKFEEKNEAFVSLGTFEEQYYDQIKKSYKTLSLYKMTGPKELNEEELDRISDEDRFWIEPYSLNPFSLKTLTTASSRYLPSDDIFVLRDHENQIKKIEKEDVLRVGHFIYDDHHFNLASDMKKMLQFSSYAEEICTSILSIIEKNKKIIIVFPLHSEIKYLLPKLLEIANSRSYNLNYMFSMAEHELGPRPYYLIPIELAKNIEQYYASIEEGKKVNQLEILILDDTIASGRTLETLMRAIYLEDKSNKKKSPKIKSSIKKIYFFCIVNRMGRSKGTLLALITSWRNIEFELKAFMEYDVPVYDSNNCPLCEDLDNIKQLERFIKYKFGGKINSWLNLKKEELSPILIQTRKFEKLDARKFPLGVEFKELGGVSTQTAGTSILIFLEKAERGCPAKYLLSAIQSFLNSNKDILYDKSLIVFRRMVWLWFIDNWTKVCADNGKELFFKLIGEEFLNTPSLAIDICEYCSRKYYLSAFESTQKLIFLMELIDTAFNCFRTVLISNSKGNEDLFTALYLIWININLKVEKNSLLINSFIENVNKIEDYSATLGDFMGSPQRTFKNMMKISSVHSTTFLDYVKLASSEIKSCIDRKKEKNNHRNRIKTHLDSLQGTYFDFANSDAASKVSSSIGFLEYKSQMLLIALNNIIEIYDLKLIESDFKTLEMNFNELSLNLKNINLHDLEKEKYWEKIIESKNNIEELLYNKNSKMYKILDQLNVSVGEIFELIEQEIEKNNLKEKLIIEFIDENLKNSTVFGDYYEIINLLSNHSIHLFLEQNYNYEDKIGEIKVKIIIIEPPSSEKDENDYIDIYLLSDNANSYEEIFEKVIKGKGLRTERWSLTKFGFESKIVDIKTLEISKNNQDYKFCLRFRFIQAYK